MLAAEALGLPPAHSSCWWYLRGDTDSEISSLDKAEREPFLRSNIEVGRAEEPKPG